MAPRSQTVALNDVKPEPIFVPDDENVEINLNTEGWEVQENEDGSVIVGEPEEEFEEEEGYNSDFYANLALKMDEGELGVIAIDLLEGVEKDIQSRKDWVEQRAKGIDLLGLKLKEPRSDLGPNGQGMATIDHPLLLEATIQFQATARAELLPATGPVKVRNDSTLPQTEELKQTNVQEQLRETLTSLDSLAWALERDMNHYLTVDAPEYVPDTDRMFFSIGFGGDAFKKIYNCPIRMRPVSETVDAEDLIVSNAATDLKNCPRVTHRIMMQRSTLRRMQIMGVYRDTPIRAPGLHFLTQIDKKVLEVAGFNPEITREKDRAHEIYEIYCELELDQFAPKPFKGKGICLPYRVTIERESRQVLDVRRNWNEDDEQCLAKQFFVQFPFIRGLGFYGLGYVHLLGNTVMALTAAWREMLDAGMFASFPGFIYAKQLGRQLTNEFRVAPGSGVPIDVGPGGKISDSIMPIPYKDVGAQFSGFMQQVEETGRQLASSPSIQASEGKADAPVGSTLAAIEQSTKIIDSVHKRLHASQAEEFRLLKERFREDPEAFWRFNKQPTMEWTKDQFIRAINENDLVPVADPNNPTSLHRIAKATILKELQTASPDLYDPTAIDLRILRIAGIDPEGLFRKEDPPPPPDPKMEAIKAKAQAEKEQVEVQLAEQRLRHSTEMAKIADKERDRDSRERIQAMRIELEKLKLQVEIGQVDPSQVGEMETQIYEQYAKEQLALDEKSRMERMRLEAQREMEGDKLAVDMLKQQRDHLHEKEMAGIKAQETEKVENIREQGKLRAEMMRPAPTPAPKGKSNGGD